LAGRVQFVENVSVELRAGAHVRHALARVIGSHGACDRHALVAPAHAHEHGRRGPQAIIAEPRQSLRRARGLGARWPSGLARVADRERISEAAPPLRGPVHGSYVVHLTDPTELAPRSE
jgi:hypothetical protein